MKYLQKYSNTRETIFQDSLCYRDLFPTSAGFRVPTDHGDVLEVQVQEAWAE